MKARALAALALVAVAACSDDAGPVASEGPAAFLPCLFDGASALQPGEVRQVRGTEGEIVCLDGGGDYALVPFFAVRNGRTQLKVSAVGGNLQSASELGAAASLGASGVAGFPRTGAGAEASHTLHMNLRDRMGGEVSKLLRASGGSLANRAGTSGAPSLAAASGAATAGAVVAASVPAVGDLLQLNVPLFNGIISACDNRNTRPARVAAVTRRAIIVHDQGNPVGGFTDAEYRAFGEQFDNLVFPVDSAAFGLPTDLDESGGRVIVFFTQEVNRLTPPGSSGYIGGFFWAGDLFPRVSNAGFEGCPASNAGEIFYIMVPDPVRAGPFTKENVQRGAIGTLAHEMEHLISASRRLYLLNAPLEESWLDEGLAHIAEELVFYRATGLQPRQNLGLSQLQQNVHAADTYMLDNLLRYMTYLEKPDSNSLIGQDDLPTRGAAWAFLRYAADRLSGPDEAFFYNLVNSRETGGANVSARIGEDAIDWMQDWTLSVYTDDAVSGVDERYLQPSWHFRSIMPIFTTRGNFPLRTIPLTSAGTAQADLLGGGTAFFRFGIPSGGRAALRLSAVGRATPETLRFSIVRTQ